MKFKSLDLVHFRFIFIFSGNYSGTINEPSDIDFDIWGYLIANA
jgi:hypothetical protein